MLGLPTSTSAGQRQRSNPIQRTTRQAMIEHARNPLASTSDDPSSGRSRSTAGATSSVSGAYGNTGGAVLPRCGGIDGYTGLQNERVLMLVYRSLNWDPHLLCVAACVSRRVRAVANRVLWREVCISRAPRMISNLTPGGTTRIGGGWHALAKLLFFCCGCAASTRFFPLPERRHPTPGHFAPVSRFSKTSGRSFLARRCWGDLLYVSDPCEHPAGSPTDEDMGAYRGVFRGFMRSRTRAHLISRQAELESRVRCPYCGARVWSMTAAGLVPRSASRRLGSHHEGNLEYFVCVNGHLHGYCWLAHLSSSDDDEDCGDGNDSDDDEDDDGHVAC